MQRNFAIYVQERGHDGKLYAAIRDDGKYYLVDNREHAEKWPFYNYKDSLNILETVRQQFEDGQDAGWKWGIDANEMPASDNKFDQEWENS